MVSFVRRHLFVKSASLCVKEVHEILLRGYKSEVIFRNTVGHKSLGTPCTCHHLHHLNTEL